MKIARYQHNDTEALRVVLTLTEAEHALLGKHAFVDVWTDTRGNGPGQLIVVPGTKFAVQPDVLANGEHSFRITILQPLFPGTKVFGAEAVETEFVDGKLVANFPLMLMPVKTRGEPRKPVPKKGALSDHDVGALLNELNERRRKDKRLSFSLVDGYIKAVTNW